jgi:hypothetical protein
LRNPCGSRGPRDTAAQPFAGVLGGTARSGQSPDVASLMDPTEYEHQTLTLALEGDADAGAEALRLCVSGLDAGHLSPALSAYLGNRLHGVVLALDDAEKLRGIKSSGAIRSARDGGIAEALRINRPVRKRLSPAPAWQTPLAAIGWLLRRRRRSLDQCYAQMDQARLILENKSLSRREAERILGTHAVMGRNSNRALIVALGPQLRGMLPTFLRETGRR